MATGDLYEIIDVQTYLGQQTLNVYHYKQISSVTVGTVLDSLRGTFTGQIWPNMLDLQSGDLTHVGLIITNLDNEDEFGSFPDNTAGGNTGDGQPPFVALSFRYARASRAVRNGQKRIGGMVETFISEGVLIGAGLASAQQLAIEMGRNLTDVVSGGTWEPRILHRATEEGPGGDPPATPRADYGILSVAYVQVTTQNTRKFGRGA